MNKVFIEESTLTAIGDSIRDKTGKQDLISPLNMPTEIESIKGGNIIKTVSGICPITLENCVEGNLLDYKIYGAEGGVGDKTKNLFSTKNVTGNSIRIEYNANYPGVEFLHFIDSGDGLVITGDFKENTQYTLTTLLHRYSASTAKHANYKWFYTDGTTSINRIFGKDTVSTSVSDAGKTVQKIAVSSSYSTDALLDLSVTQLEEGTKSTAFEPSGYIIPLKINDTTYKAYLGMNQLGTDAYLDYENRCVVKSDGTRTHLDLPEIPLIEGTNTFDIETTVKPSNVSLTYVKNIEFNTMKTVEGTLPLTVEGVGQKLEDYKIYGTDEGVGNLNRLNQNGNIAGCVEVEYIQSDGVGTHQYVDTGYIPTENTRVELKWLSTDISGSQAVIGCSWSANAMLLDIQNGKWCFHGNNFGTSAVPSLTEPDVISYSSAASSFVINGVIYNNTADNLSNATTSLKIFGVGSNLRYAKGKLYYLNIYEGDTLVREYVPVIKGDVCGLWDNINNKFITSTDITAFTSGPINYVIVPINVNDNIYNVKAVSPLNSGDYIDFENRCIVKSDGTKTCLDLPEIYLQNGQNIIDVDTTVKPSKMSVSYIDNDGGYDAGYKKGYDAMKLAIDMSDVDYQFNETVTSYPGNWYRINLNFTDANGNSYNQMAPYTSSGKININYWLTSGSTVAVYNAANNPAWTNEAYRTIHITDGTMTGDIKTFTWFMNNGVFNPTA